MMGNVQDEENQSAMTEKKTVVFDKPGDSNKVLRWQLYLPNGDLREIQVPQITENSPVHAYESVPWAGTVYGCDILQARSTHLLSIISTYLPIVNDAMRSNQGIDLNFENTAEDPNGLLVIQSEYEEVLKNNNGSESTPLPEQQNKKYTADQLVFGLNKIKSNWIRDDLNLETGNLSGVDSFGTTYYVWLGEGKCGLYREYRIDEKWIWSSFSSDFQTKNETHQNANKFLDYASEIDEEFGEMWQLVKKTHFPALDTLLCALSSTPKRGMMLFSDLNFSNLRKWHQYKPLKKHEPLKRNELHMIDENNFEGDVQPNWKAAMNTMADKLQNMSHAETRLLCEVEPVGKDDRSKRDLAIRVATAYKQLNDKCKSCGLDPENLEVVRKLPQYANFLKHIDEYTPSLSGDRVLRLDKMGDLFNILDRIGCFHRLIKSEGKKASSKLEDNLSEANKMYTRLKNAAYVFEYRAETCNEANKAMMAKLFMKCLDFKNDLTPLEKAIIPVVTANTQDSFEVLLNFCARFQLSTHNNFIIDPSLPLKVAQYNFFQCARRLYNIFPIIKSESLAMGYQTFERTSVSFGNN